MLISLQILRALAAIGVAFVHLGEVNGLTRGPYQFGVAGVDIFFVISGFIMVHSSSSLFGHAAAPRIFIVHRLARIVPPYWAITMIGLISYWLCYGGPLPTKSAMLCSFAFIPCGSEYGTPIYGVGWTLNYEMFFYVLFAVCVLLRRALAVIAICIALLGLVTVGAVIDLPLPWQYWSHPIIIEFAFGAALGVAYGEGLRRQGQFAGYLSSAVLLDLRRRNGYGAAMRLLRGIEPQFQGRSISAFRRFLWLLALC